jgi:hypothetical protein
LFHYHKITEQQRKFISSKLKTRENRKALCTATANVFARSRYIQGAPSKRKKKELDQTTTHNKDINKYHHELFCFVRTNLPWSYGQDYKEPSFFDNQNESVPYYPVSQTAVQVHVSVPH